jgi:hypothetical protein
MSDQNLHEGIGSHEMQFNHMHMKNLAGDEGGLRSKFIFIPMGGI